MKKPLYALLIVAALVPRLVFLAQAVENPLFTDFYLDAKSYDTWATRLADGEWAGERAFHMAPVYPYTLGVLYKITGRNLFAIKLLQHFIGAVNCLLVFLIAQRIFDRRTAWVAWALSLGYGPFLYFEGQLLASTLGIFLGLWGFYLLLGTLERGGEGLFGVGLLSGIAAVARPNLLFFMPLTAIWLAAVERVVLRRWIVFPIAFGVALLPTTIHNYALSGDFIPISSHGGISFYLGNNDFTPGTYIPPPEFGGNPEAIDIYDSKRIAERETGRELSQGEISSYWFGQSFEYIRENPLDFAALVLRKTALYFNSYEIPLDVNYEFDKSLYPIFRYLPVTLGLIIPLAAVGAVVGVRRRKRAGLLVLFVLANAASVIAFFVCARYRQTGVPAMIILAAAALVQLYEYARGRRWRPLAAGVGAAAVLALAVHADLYPGKTTGESRSLCIVGRAWAWAGEGEKAEEAYREALRRTPKHVDARMNLGLLYYREGDPGRAVAEFVEVTRLAPGFAGAWNNLGNALREAGDPEAAVRALNQAVEIDPGYAEAWNSLGYSLALGGMPAEAEASYRRALAADPGLVDPWANLADLLVAQGMFPEARGLMDEAAESLPESRGIQAKREQVGYATNLCAEVVDAARIGQADRALDALCRALAMGGGAVRIWATRAPELAALRDDPRFAAAIGGGAGN